MSPKPVIKFEFSGGRPCLDFANTVSDYQADPRRDRLPAYSELVEWAAQAGHLTAAEAKQLEREAARRPEAAERVHAEALALREAIFRVFLARAHGQDARAEDLALLDRAYSAAARHRRVTAARGRGYALAWEPAGDHLDAPLWRVGDSAVSLLTCDDCGRVRVCGGDTCTWLFVDASRNSSRRWCSMRDCGNRAKARRHYRRSKQDG
jgi:predicted RNA-binding Zn ribbon-like protein